MVRNATTFTKNGIQDWILQRVTAIIIGLYMAFLVGYFMTHSGFTYFDWLAFFNLRAFKIATLIAYIAVVIHAWLGLWIVCTDYLKSKFLRVLALVVIFICLGVSLGWLIRILWG